MLEILNLSKTYPKQRGLGCSRPALDNVSLTVTDTGLCVVCGKSGSGKSTLLHLIGGLDRPSSGSVLFNGADVSRLKKRELDRYRNRCVGFVSQDFGLVPGITAGENVALSLRLQEKDEAVIADKVGKALAEVGLGGFEKRIVNTLSGGEKQRVAIARALAQESKLLLCDEPTGNLDPDTADSVFRVLKKISGRIGVLVVTHDHILGKKYADRMVFLDGGRISGEKTPRAGTQPATMSEPRKSDATAADCSWKHERLRFCFRSFSSLFLVSLMSRIVSVVLMTVILSLLFSVLMSSEYAKEYSRSDALSSTFRDYSVSILKISRYETRFDDETKKWYTVWPQSEVPSDAFETLKAEYPDAAFGQSYMFTNTFRDFFPDADLSGRTYYRCAGFAHFIAVEDFSRFGPKLMCGDYPKDAGEVLIYDYMADNLLYFVSIPGVSEPEQLIGYTLEEKDTGLRMTISGIMKSDYRDFDFTDMDDWWSSMEMKAVTFAESYLSMLRSVVGFSSLAEKVAEGRDYISAFCLILDMSRPGDNYRTELVTDIEKIPIVYEEAGLNLIHNNDNNDVFFCISDTLLYELTGIPREELTEPRIDELFKEYDFGGRASFVRASSKYGEAIEINGWGYGADGIFRSEECKAFLLVKEEESMWKYHQTNGLYEYPVLLLSGDNQKDAAAVQQLLAPYKIEQDAPEAGTSGLGIVSYFEIILNNADDFLQDFGEIAGSYYWVGLTVILALLAVFVIVAVQKNQYTIGVLKSVGMPDVAIASVYGALVIVIAVLALALAVPGAFVITRFINGIFSETVGYPFRFFSFRIYAGLKTLAVAGGSIILALLATFTVFLTRKPVKLKNAI